jgi:hypothetical protein
MVTFLEGYPDHKDLLVPGTCVAVKGTFNKRSDELSILIDKPKVLATDEELTD